MDKLKYALIGCGRIAPNHVGAAAANADKLDLAAACDLDEAAIGRALSAYPAGESVRRYTDYRAMLEAEKPDLVAVATESGSHASIAMECLRAGCHVIVEKPIALSLADADAMIKLAGERGRRLGVSHQNRFNRSIQSIRGATEAGRFGKMHHGSANIRWHRDKTYYSSASWRGRWSQDGGALMNQCIHNIDLLLWLMGGRATEVCAYTDRLAHPYIEAEDFGAAIVRFANGAYGVIEGSMNIFPTNLEETLYLFGEHGTVKAGGVSVNRIEEWRFRDGLDDPAEVVRASAEKAANVYGFGHTPLYADMIDAIRTGRRPYIDGEAGRAALELVLAIYLSAATGAPVRLPLEGIATTDFSDRFVPALPR